MLELKYVFRLNESLFNVAALFIHPEEPSFTLTLKLPLSIGNPYLKVQQLMLRHLPLEGAHVLDGLGLV
jgi:hypothetical protein